MDERALQAAHRAFVHDDEMVLMDIIMRVRPAIEAYEAAKWRQIEEAPRDGTKICVWWAAGKGQFGHYPETMEFLWWERDCWLSDLGGRALNHDGCVDVGAMFRTIDPPKQDEAQSGVSEGTAAGTGS